MTAPSSAERSGPEWLDGLGRLPPRVRNALEKVPRERFVPARYRSRAYEDAPIPLGPSSTISAPHMVALQLVWAELRPGDRVLELGSGSGYLLALLSELVGPTGRVVGVERDTTLVRLSREVLEALSLPTLPRVLEGDGEEAAQGEGPFDRLLVSFAQTSPVPAGWLELLAPEGLAVAPLTEGEETLLVRLRRGPRGWQEVRRGPPCAFVPRQRPLP